MDATYLIDAADRTGERCAGGRGGAAEEEGEGSGIGVEEGMGVWFGGFWLYVRSSSAYSRTD